MDATLIAVLVTLVADIVAKIFSGKKSGAAADQTAEAVKELKTVVLELSGLASQMTRRMEVLEHRVTFLENYRQSADPGAESREVSGTMDSAWPPFRKRRH